jgi:hypothetical protein
MEIIDLWLSVTWELRVHSAATIWRVGLLTEENK